MSWSDYFLMMGRDFFYFCVFSFVTYPFWMWLHSCEMKKHGYPVCGSFFKNKTDDSEDEDMKKKSDEKNPSDYRNVD